MLRCCNDDCVVFVLLKLMMLTTDVDVDTGLLGGFWDANSDTTVGHR